MVWKNNKKDESIIDTNNYNLPKLQVLVTQMLSRMGRFQIVLLILLGANSAIVGISHTLTSFHIYTPKFVCKTTNETFCTKCDDGYEFLGESTSIVSEWSLICDRRLLAPMVNTLYFVGVTVGAIMCGSFADMYGRRLLIWACLYIQCLLGICLYFTETLELFIVLRTIQGFFVQGLQGVTYTLMLEYCPANKRTGAGVMFEIFWAVGLGIMGTSSYLISDWRILQLALAVPCLLTLFYSWMFPESILWLIASNKPKQAHILSLKFAKRNNDLVFIDQYENLSLQSRKKSLTVYENGVSEITEPEHKEQATQSVGLLDIARNRILRKHAGVMVSIWFSVTLSYYGILFYLPNLAGERHANFLIGAGVEVIAYVIAFFILSRYGRRIPMASYQIINGGICILVALISIFFETGYESWKDPLIVCLTLIAKGLAVSSFCGMFIFGGELFPTICRAAALGLCGFSARVGSLLAPQLLILGEYTFTSLPMIIMGVLVIVTGIGTLFLPETLEIEMPNSISEVNEMWS